MSTDLSAGRSRYSAVAMTFHWLIAALIIGNVALAWISDEVPRSTAAGLMAWRIIESGRLRAPSPQLVPGE